jgi:hypothetical protein
MAYRGLQAQQLGLPRVRQKPANGGEENQVKCAAEVGGANPGPWKLYRMQKSFNRSGLAGFCSLRRYKFKADSDPWKHRRWSALYRARRDKWR